MLEEIQGDAHELFHRIVRDGKFKANLFSDHLFTVVTHVEGDGDVQTYDLASVTIDVSSIPEVDTPVSV